MTNYTSIDIMYEGYESWFFFSLSLSFFGKFLLQGSQSFVSRPVVSIVMKRRRFISVKVGESKALWHASLIQGRQRIIIDITDVVTREVSSNESTRFAISINQLHDLIIICETYHGYIPTDIGGHKILPTCSGICVWINDVRRCKLTVNDYMNIYATVRFRDCDTSKSHDINNRLQSTYVPVECACNFQSSIPFSLFSRDGFSSATSFEIFSAEIADHTTSIAYILDRQLIGSLLYVWYLSL